MENNADVVYELQEYLRSIWLSDPEMQLIVPDGIFGEETTQAVQDFQRRQGLPQTGKVDLEDWNRLREESLRVQYRRSAPAQIAPIGNDDLPLRRGDSGNLVMTAQQMLQYLSELFENFFDIALDGIFGVDTEGATRRWQYVCRLPQTGEIDKDTWNRLAKMYTLKY